MSFEVEDRVAGATERLLGEGTPFTRLGKWATILVHFFVC